MWFAILIITLGIVWMLAYHGANVFSRKIVGWRVALLVTLSTDISWYLATPLLLLTASVVLLLGVPGIRRRYVTLPLLLQFRRVMPGISQTEKEALDVGTVWWDAELFSGRPDWDKLLRTPPVQLSPEEQAFLDGPVETLCRMLDDWQITQHDHDLSAAVWQFIRREKFFGMIIPEQYGGLGFSAYAHSQVVMKLASRSITAAVTVMVPNSLGPGKLLLHYGTDEQKQRYLPRLASGEEIPCFALTGPHAGSDAGALPDTGTVCHGQWHGRKVLGLRLNWE